MITICAKFICQFHDYAEKEKSIWNAKTYVKREDIKRAKNYVKRTINFLKY